MFEEIQKAICSLRIGAIAAAERPAEYFASEFEIASAKNFYPDASFDVDAITHRENKGVLIEAWFWLFWTQSKAIPEKIHSRFQQYEGGKLSADMSMLAHRARVARVTADFAFFADAKEIEKAVQRYRTTAARFHRGAQILRSVAGYWLQGWVWIPCVTTRSPTPVLVQAQTGEECGG